MQKDGKMSLCDLDCKTVVSSLTKTRSAVSVDLRARELRRLSPVSLSVFTLGPDLSIEDRSYSYDKPTQKIRLFCSLCVT